MTIVTVSVIVLVVLILFIGLYVYAQKHRTKERKQLNHLLEQTEMVLCVCCGQVCVADKWCVFVVDKWCVHR